MEIRYVPDATEHVSPTAAQADTKADNGWDERVIKQEQGERLYPFVCAQTQNRDAEIITGMLLEMPISQVEALISDADSLALHIVECQASLAKQREADLAQFVQEIAATAVEAGGSDRGPVLDKLRTLVDGWSLDTTRVLGLADERSPVHLYVYGSYLLGVAGPDSDVDVLIAVPAHICRARHFFGLRAPGGKGGEQASDSLLERLNRDKRVTNLVAVPDAFVPCIKLHFNGIDLDLTFANLGAPSLPQQPANRASWAGDIDSLTNTILADLAEDAPSLRSVNGVRATHALLRVVPSISTFRSTLRMVKTWARTRGVYGNQLGFFGGISWAILTAKICQDFPSSSAEHTLALFFRVYVSWQWPTPVRLRGVLLPGMAGGPKQSAVLDDMVWNPETNPDDLRHYMPIITPVYPCMNSTFNTAPSNFRVIKSELDRAALITGPTLAGGVFSAPTLHQSGRAFFFSRYEWYLRLDIVASEPESQKKWVGLVQALLRHLIRSLESTRLFLVHPWPELLDTDLSDPVQRLADKARLKNGSGVTPQATYFLGLITDDANTLTVPISDAVAEFRRMAKMRAAGWHNNGMIISERIIRRGDLPPWVTKEVKSLGDGVITPGRSIANTDFCPCVDEHQLNIRETAIMARNSGIAASKVAGIMAKRRIVASDAERSRVAEFNCTHDNLLAAVDQLRTEKDAALEQLKVMKKREGQLTERSKRKDKERERAEKATESSWRDEKEELEFDLENIRSALLTSNGKAADAEKRVRRLETELAKTREAAAQASKSKASEAGSSATPKPSPKRERKGKGGGGGSGGGSSSGGISGGGGAAGNEPGGTGATPTEKKKNKQKTKQQQQDRKSPEKKVDKEKNNRSDKRHSSTSSSSSSLSSNDRQCAQKLCNTIKKRWKVSMHESLTSKPIALGMLGIGAIVAAVLAVGFSVLRSTSDSSGSTEVDNYTTVGAEHDGDVCASQPCRHKGVCTASDVNDSYRCACKEGFHGNTCEMKFWDRVASDEAEEAEGAQAVKGSELAAMAKSWWESAAGHVDSIDDTTVCADGPCLNGGECVTGLDFDGGGTQEQTRGGTGRCRCLQGFEGPSCEFDVDECSSDPCVNGGECVDQPGGFSCLCSPIWGGDICNIRQPANKPNTQRFAAVTTDKSTPGEYVADERQQKYYEDFGVLHGTVSRSFDDAWHSRQEKKANAKAALRERELRPFLDDEKDAVPYLAAASYDKGSNLFESNDFEGSSDVFRRSLDFGHPDTAEAHSRLGESLYRLALAQEKPELTAELLQAYEHFNLAVALQPLDSHLWSLRGNCERLMGDAEGAARDMHQSHRLSAEFEQSKT